MKRVRWFLSLLLLTGTVGWSALSLGAEAVVSKVAATPDGSYCHLRFPAIREETLAGDRPALKDASAGDIIDFYGPCDYDPLGKAAVEAQRMDEQRGYFHMINND